MENSERSNARHSVWLQTFTVNLEDLERCARTFLRKSDLRFGRWGFKSGEHKNGSIVFMLTSAKTKRDLVCAQKSMVTWQQQQSTILSEGCESRNNHRYAVVVQVLATQWNPWKTKTSQETENNLRKFPEAVTEAESYSYVQIIRIWQVLWRIILQSSNNYTSSIREKRNCRTSCTSNKRRDISRTIAVWISDDKWWLDSMKCCCYLRNDQDLLADGKS